MAPPALSFFGLRALAALGCALAIAAQALPTGRQTLRGRVPPAVAPLKPIGPLADTNRLRLALGLPARHQDKLAALLRDLYDPSSAQFHQFLKPSEFAARFGPTKEDYATVAVFDHRRHPTHRCATVLSHLALVAVSHVNFRHNTALLEIGEV